MRFVCTTSELSAIELARPATVLAGPQTVADGRAVISATLISAEGCTV